MKTAWLKFKRKWFPKLFAATAKAAVRLILATCKKNVHGIARFISTAGTDPCVLMLWHNKLVIVSEILHSNPNAARFIYTAFISKSRDGDPLAALAESYKTGRALRVAHDGRHLALNQMINDLKNRSSIYVITPDGPRGPALSVKPGTALAAREASAKIIPFNWRADKYWELKTWDRMQIPKPFSTIDVYFGEPLDLSKHEDREQDSALLESILNRHS